MSVGAQYQAGARAALAGAPAACGQGFQALACATIGAAVAGSGGLGHGGLGQQPGLQLGGLAAASGLQLGKVVLAMGVECLPAFLARQQLQPALGVLQRAGLVFAQQAGV